ncbi:RNA-directed DNA polymerase, eukaryota [Tanacetum coccineum]
MWIRGSQSKLSKSQGLTHKAKKDWVKELCVSNKVNFLTLQETKMESIELFDIKRCWGNFAFDYVHSASVGNSGGILCVWDSNSFMKLNATVSDYFVMVRGTWVTNGKMLLIISVYAPQELTEKKLLWDYLRHVIANWKGEVIVMGDFNECGFRGGSPWRMLVHIAITLDKYLSDHRPIILRESTYDYGPIPFRFFHYWFEVDGFEKLVNEAWYEAPVDASNAMLNLMYKLKYLKKKIRAWNGMRKCSKNSKYMLKTELADLNVIIDKGDASDDIISKRTEVVNSIEELEKLKSMEAAQKAKIKWAIEGDENSKYYHGILNKKRNQLSIRGVLAAGSWIENLVLVKNEFLNHFKNWFERPKKERLILNTDFPCKLTSIQQSDMDSEVSNEEIKRAVWDCGIDKSPGPDGFTFGFYRRFWKLIEKDMVAAVKHFFQSGSIPKCCNSSFIALIPKSPNAKMVKEFRPISLIGSLYKIIAKILANRLVLVLGDIVNEVQSAFVADRQILDGPFILNEIFQWCKSKKKHSFIFKVDFEKAYDSVRWDYLDDVLKKFGFGERWCGWIQECLRSSWGSVIVNGSPTEEFQFFKGLKQGDPLSPFLFILIMESLHISFQRIVDAGMFKGIVLDSSMHLSHMFYADDAVFVGQWSNSNIDTIVHVLKCFHCASGLSINMSKSSKVGGSMSRIQSWNEIVDNMAARLSKWKMKTLSIGGRLTLLKSVLGSMPIYHMSIFKVPMKVIQRMESIRCYFFNGVDLGSKKSIWVKWNNVLASKEKGGLGVSSLYALNRALMFKWVWRFTTQKTSLWARVIKAIHGDDGKIRRSSKSGHTSIWRDIVQEMDAFKKQENTALKHKYPRLYALELNKNIEVAAKLAQTSLMWALEGSGDFSVASVRKLIDDKRLPVVSSKTRWIKAVPIKVNVHAWKVSLDCLPTRLNISRRGLDIASILCPICGIAVESSRHLFFDCHVAKDMFCKICRWWDVDFMENHDQSAITNFNANANASSNVNANTNTNVDANADAMPMPMPM